MPPGVMVMGRSEAEMLLRRPGCPRLGGVISIRGGGEAGFEPGGSVPRLALRFDDVDTPDVGDALGRVRAWAQKRWAKEIGRPLRHPTPRDAEAIIRFARDVADADGAVLCVCQAGISRSAAAALLCLAAWSKDGDEAATVAHLLRVRPAAVPLRSLVGFGDGVLGRGGRLVRAVMDARRGDKPSTRS